jgi:hypothetical protein
MGSHTRMNPSVAFFTSANSPSPGFPRESHPACVNKLGYWIVDAWLYSEE